MKDLVWKSKQCQDFESTNTIKFQKIDSNMNTVNNNLKQSREQLLKKKESIKNQNRNL